jgi:OOP family OmpA-OmpF porin
LPQLEIAGGMSVRVEGNTDGVGERSANQALSEKRAAAIVEYLIARGVPRTRLVARGNGSAKPVAFNTTAEGRAQNRRTDVVFIRGAQ